VLNPDLHKHVVTNEMSTASAVSENLGKISITEYQHQGVVLKKEV